MLKNKTKLNIFIFLLIILFISTGCVFNNGKKIKTSNNNQKVIQKNNKTNNKTKSPEQISSSTIKEDLNQKDNKQLAASTTETKDLDTSDWQTYRNEEYGFEIRYPGNWYHSSPAYKQEKDNCIINYVLGLSPDGFNGEWKFVVGVTNNNIKQILNNPNYLWNKYWNIISKTNINLGNIKGIKVVWSNNVALVYVQDNDKSLTIQFDGYHNDQYDKILETIISSLKFIK